MAKEKDYTIVARAEVPAEIAKDFVYQDGGPLVIFRDTFMQDKKESPFFYVGPKDGASFKLWVSSLTDEKVLDKAYSDFMYALDLKGRAAARESVAAESTEIVRDGKKFDLMALPAEKAVAAVNAMYAWAATTGADPQKACVVTRRKLLEQGTAKEQNGVLVVNKK